MQLTKLDRVNTPAYMLKL